MMGNMHMMEKKDNSKPFSGSKVHKTSCTGTRQKRHPLWVEESDQPDQTASHLRKGYCVVRIPFTFSAPGQVLGKVCNYLLSSLNHCLQHCPPFCLLFLPCYLLHCALHQAPVQTLSLKAEQAFQGAGLQMALQGYSLKLALSPDD